MAMLPNFCAPSGAVRSSAADPSRTINLYVENLPNDPRQFILYGMPGLRPVMLLPSGPVRGVFETTGGRTFAVTSTTLYELFAGGT